MANEAMDFFTTSESSLLKKTNEIRLNLIDDITADGVPTRSGDIRVLNETLDAADRQVMEVAKIRAKQQEVEGNSKTIGMVVEILSRVSNGGATHLSNNDIALPDTFIPIDVVPGETDTGPEELELSTFIRSEENE